MSLRYKYILELKQLNVLYSINTPTSNFQYYALNKSYINFIVNSQQEPKYIRLRLTSLVTSYKNC